MSLMAKPNLSEVIKTVNHAEVVRGSATFMLERVKFYEGLDMTNSAWGANEIALQLTVKARGIEEFALELNADIFEIMHANAKREGDWGGV